MIYLYGLRAAHLKDHPWPSSFRALYSSCKRSLERGLGPAKHAGALAVEKMCDAMQADALKQAATVLWPAAGIDALVVACAWGCREVETSTTFLKSVKVHQPTKSVGRWASWELPVSKADPKALGKHRALACACPAPTCPACAMHRVTLASWTIAKRLHPACVPDTWPLLVTAAGNALSKTQTVAFYKEATRAVGETADLITGHSARSTCAIRMALAGHSLLVIQLFCRWGSSVVMRYVQEAPLGRHGGDIAAITEGQPRMDALQEAIMTKLQESMIQKKVGSLMDLSVEAVAEKVLPRLIPPRAHKLDVEAEVSKALRGLTSHLSSIEADLAGIAGAKPPPFVKCDDPAAKAHATVSSDRTFCGFRWAASGALPFPEAEWARLPVAEEGSRGGRCIRCSKCAPLGNHRRALTLGL